MFVDDDPDVHRVEHAYRQSAPDSYGVGLGMMSGLGGQQGINNLPGAPRLLYGRGFGGMGVSLPRGRDRLRKACSAAGLVLSTACIPTIANHELRASRTGPFELSSRSRLSRSGPRFGRQRLPSADLPSSHAVDCERMGEVLHVRAGGYLPRDP